MAEPISLASGLLTLTTFAFKSSMTLYETIKSFQSHPKTVRDLLEELEALSGVLAPLTDIVNTTVDLSALALPLLRCGNACKEYKEEIMKCSSRSGGGRTSFRDWAKLRYMGDDINGFTLALAGYKLTINIALTDANLRRSAVNAEMLEGYKDLVKNAKTDLEARLENIDGKLERIIEQTIPESNSDVLELQRIKDDRASTEKCLQIVAQLSSHISQIQLTPGRGDSSPGQIDSDTLPENITSEGLQECKNSLILTTAKLEKLMRDTMDRLVTKSRTSMASEEEHTNLARLQAEWETARQCINICSRADNNLKQNISTIDNYATGDAMQFMVSTSGKVIHGKNRGLGWRSRQVGGYLSDASVQQLSRDMTSINTRDESSLSPGNTPLIPDGGGAKEPTPDFRERHGRGYRLTPKSSLDIPRSTGLAEGQPSSSPMK